MPVPYLFLAVLICLFDILVSEFLIKIIIHDHVTVSLTLTFMHHFYLHIYLMCDYEFALSLLLSLLQVTICGSNNC
jgi:hypothetical protein